MGINLIAAGWGLAESTLFFIVPDVWCSLAGRANLRSGLVACVWSLLGALLGGVIMYRWGAQNLGQASQVVLAIPAISAEMLERVRAELIEQGLWAILMGPLTGTPYKLYAIQSATVGLNFWAFLFISIPARLFRFLLVTVFCHYALKVIQKGLPGIDSQIILLGCWTTFYLFYFSHMAS